MNFTNPFFVAVQFVYAVPRRFWFSRKVYVEPEDRDEFLAYNPQAVLLRTLYEPDFMAVDR